MTTNTDQGFVSTLYSKKPKKTNTLVHFVLHLIAQNRKKNAKKEQKSPEPQNQNRQAYIKIIGKNEI